MSGAAFNVFFGERKKGFRGGVNPARKQRNAGKGFDLGVDDIIRKCARVSPQELSWMLSNQVCI